MALSMLVAVIAAPGLLGSQEAIRQSQSQEKREEHRARRCNLIATCVKSSNRSREISGRPLVLRNGKLWIDTGTEDGTPVGHPYAGYYLPYPDSKHEGLVTTITDLAPIMNWIYVDKDTHEVKYGVRLDAQPHLTGPFDCTRQDRRLTFDGWEGFCVVEEGSGTWALYFDVSDDGLQSKIQPGTRVLEIELSRKEKRFQKEPNARLHDQTTKRAVDAQEEAPSDRPLVPEALVSKPVVVDQTPQIQYEPLKPKPFRMPKSIFEDPPPVLESSVFKRLSIPPPANTATGVNKSPTAVELPAVNTVTVAMNPVNTPTLSRARQIVDTAQSIIDPSSEISRAQRATFSPRAALSPLFKVPRNRSTSTSSTASNYPDEKGATPRRNRSSGTRALAQAQMFEAMAAAQNSSVEVRAGSSRRISQASSNADSGSQYSGDSLSVYEENNADPEILQQTKSTTLSPLALTVTKTKEPRKRAEVQIFSGAIPSKGTAPEPRTTPRQRALTDPRDPAIFGVGTKISIRGREPARQSKTNTMPSSRPPMSRTSSQASKQSPRPPLQKSGTRTGPSGSPRALMERSNTADSPRAPPQAYRASTRTSLASTMTSGRRNKNMTARVGGAGERSRAVTIQGGSRVLMRRKTTSALFREIDELVGQDESGPSSYKG